MAAATATFADPHKYEPGSNRPKMSDFINALLILEVTGRTESVDVTGDSGQLETRVAVIAHVVAVDGRHAGERFPDFWIFQTGIKAAIDGFEPGTRVLGRLVKPQNAYILAEPTAADRKAAAALLS